MFIAFHFVDFLLTPTLAMPYVTRASCVLFNSHISIGFRISNQTPGHGNLPCRGCPHQIPSSSCNCLHKPQSIEKLTSRSCST
ncbi:hypothetical protein BYT27DRAFT_6541279 [Phlegmacium glaucopus]|nr:hypothetical protein BYT27DRAFT_6541279 [Phlegmacium glaucopus]